MTDYVALKTLCRYSTPCQCGTVLCATDPDLPPRLLSKSNISTRLHHVIESAIAELSTKLGNCILLKATSILTVTMNWHHIPESLNFHMMFITQMVRCYCFNQLMNFHSTWNEHAIQDHPT